MKDKIRAFYKIIQATQSSKNELHLKTCTIMIGLFSIRYKDESMKAFLKEELDAKRDKIKRVRFENVLVVNY